MIAPLPPDVRLGGLLKTVSASLRTLVLFSPRGPCGPFTVDAFRPSDPLKDGPGAPPVRLVIRTEGRDLAGVLEEIALALMATPEGGDDAPDLGRLFALLASKSRTTMFYFPRPEETGFGLEWTDRVGRPGRTTRDLMVEALRDAIGEDEVLRSCPRCGVTKPVSEFPRDASRPSGRFPYCKTCNRAHVAAYHQAQHARQQQRSGNTGNDRRRRFLFLQERDSCQAG